MNLLLFNLATDYDDPILGFATGWVNALARLYDQVFVITMRAGRVCVTPNVTVYSVGKEKGYSEVRRVFEFYRILVKILRQQRIDACFSHMIPVFTVLAAPLLRVRRIPLITWYAHRQLTTTLKLAHHLSDRMVSINENSYPYKKDKLVCTGHGIDTELFCPDGTMPDDPPLLLSVGRLSPIKNLEVLIDAVEILHKKGLRLQCVLVGDAPEHDRKYADALKERVQAKGLEGTIRFVGAVSNRDVVLWYRRCTAHINCAPANNAVDKAVLEAMACGKPSFTSAQSFSETIGRWAEILIFRERNAEDLAQKIEILLGMDTQNQMVMVTDLREAVLAMHSLKELGEKMAMLFCGHAVV